MRSHPSAQGAKLFLHILCFGRLSQTYRPTDLFAKWFLFSGGGGHMLITVTAAALAKTQNPEAQQTSNLNCQKIV